MPTNALWIEAARSRLLALRRSDGAWSYRPGSPSAVEPSSLAALALLATGQAPGGPDDRAVATEVARWIAERACRSDGSTVVVLGLGGDSPGWTTPYALLLWNALGGFDRERRAAEAWLLASKGEGDKPGPNNPMGHDVTLIGWPWVADTHSWVEPTAASLLALAPGVPARHPRMLEGVLVLLDRATPTGGWNLGNPVVFGRKLRPLPGPTGLALLALARVARESTPAPMVRQAVAYLLEVVGQTSAPTSLGWSWLGLRAWNARLDPPVEERLGAATFRAIARDASASELAMLLLAAGDRSLDVLGITPRPMREPAR